MTIFDRAANARRGRTAERMDEIDVATRVKNRISTWTGRMTDTSVNRVETERNTYLPLVGRL